MIPSIFRTNLAVSIPIEAGHGVFAEETQWLLHHCYSLGISNHSDSRFFPKTRSAQHSLTSSKNELTIKMGMRLPKARHLCVFVWLKVCVDEHNYTGNRKEEYEIELRL